MGVKHSPAGGADLGEGRRGAYLIMNPCVRLRLVMLGWYVRFTHSRGSIEPFSGSSMDSRMSSAACCSAKLDC
jgi:hypothetical protein